jgi:transcriptional regulator with XRE-family HTH domain
LTDETFGDRLAEARIRKGLSIEQVSNILRIRSSIIDALESCTFSHMPLKGYSRNMVSSYARFLGLNSTDITEQFLREYREFERLQRRSHVTHIDEPEAYSAIYPEPGTINRSTRSRETVNMANRGKGSRSYWSTENPDALNRNIDPTSRRSARRNDSRRATARDQGRPPNSIRNQHYTSSRPQGSLLSRMLAPITTRPVLLIVLLAIVAVAVLVVWATLASNCARNNENLLPVTGASSSSTEGISEEQLGNSLEEIQAQTAQDARYGPFDLKIVVDGGASWLQVTVDGTTELANVIDGPWEQTYRVSGSAQVQSGAPSYVKVYRNGEEVPIGLDVISLEVQQKPEEPQAGDANAGSEVPNINE